MWRQFRWQLLGYFPKEVIAQSQGNIQQHIGLHGGALQKPEGCVIVAPHVSCESGDKETALFDVGTDYLSGVDIWFFHCVDIYNVRCWLAVSPDFVMLT